MQHCSSSSVTVFTDSGWNVVIVTVDVTVAVKVSVSVVNVSVTVDTSMITH